MRRKGFLLLVLLFVSLALVGTALADAPAAGTVYEGIGVPGIDLGFTRAQVEDIYGNPLFCQSVEEPGDFAACSFPVSGGGQVDIRYRGPAGGNASNSPDDVVYNIRWHEQVSGWTTTAGVNTTLAKVDPDAVIAAYPQAQVTYNIFGQVYSVIDAQQGIEIIWALDFYSGRTHVSMAIFGPYQPPPPAPQQVHVESIDLTASKDKGQRAITALVRLQNEQELAAPGATVSATWTFPDGTSQAVQDVTSSSGYAYFQLGGRLSRGTYTLTIDDVTLAGYVFDRESSVLSATIFAR